MERLTLRAPGGWVPARRACRPARCMVAPVASGLQGWQVVKLREALGQVTSSRKVQVDKLSKDLGVQRQEVLDWLKAQRDQPGGGSGGGGGGGSGEQDRAQQSLEGARAAVEAAAFERQAILHEQEQLQAQQGGGGMGQGRPRGGPTDWQQQRGAQARGPAAAGAPAAGRGEQPWRQHYRNKHLGRQAEATLEMIFERTQWPTDDVVAGLWDLHRLPRDKVVEWFRQQRRKQNGSSSRVQRRYPRAEQDEVEE